MAGAKKITLAEAVAESIRLADVSGLRRLVEKNLAEEDKHYGDGPCSDAFDNLVPMLGRDELLKERFLGTGHDWFRALEDTETPRWQEWTNALEKEHMDTYEAIKAFKKACMRRRPERG